MWNWALYYFNPPKNIILNRIEGTISYPKEFFYKTQTTVPFSEVEFCQERDEHSTHTEDYSEHTRNEYLYIRHPKTNTTLPLLSVEIGNPDTTQSNLDELCELRSFYVWYMDKNRPLPPGTAFDPYRKKDFDRRRSEGFKSPLYKSGINTPEQNSYQTKVKNNYKNT